VIKQFSTLVVVFDEEQAEFFSYSSAVIIASFKITSHLIAVSQGIKASRISAPTNLQLFKFAPLKSTPQQFAF